MSLRNRKSLSGMLLSVVLSISHIGCGGRSPSTTAGSGAPFITVGVETDPFTSSPITVQVGGTVQFSATVTGDPQNAGVNWTVTCPATSCGSLSPRSTANQGATTYIPPVSVPASDLTVTVTAASITDAKAQGSFTIIVPSVAVTVGPNPATVTPGAAAQFTATVSGDSTNAGVTWILAVCHSAISGQVCLHPPTCNCGTISGSNSASGVPITYAAPASQPSGGQLTLTATSVANAFAITVVPITISASADSSSVGAGSPAFRNFQAMASLNPIALRHSFHPNATVPQSQREVMNKQAQFEIINLGTLGGSSSNGFGGPNNQGWVTGDANLAGDQTEHAFLWRDGVMTDLGTLGGLNSSVSFPVRNSRGLITGVAQTATADPLGEFWGNSLTCGTASQPAACQGSQNLERGFVWQGGVMTSLPTLGGNNGAALGANNRGQVVGVAETSIQDPSCAPPQVLDFDAVIWGPKPNEIHVLPTLPGDSVAAAAAINDEGEVVGSSGVCAFPPQLLFAVHAVLWRDGTVTDLGSLGGQMFNFASAINNGGQVVGQSDLPGDNLFHAFLWQDGAMTDLGTLPGDANSMATDINEKGQVVGTSCDATFSVCRAFLWEDGVMTDLNALIPPNSSLFLAFGGGINDRGEIAGSAFDPITGEAPAFLALPCDERHADVEGCRDRD